MFQVISRAKKFMCVLLALAGFGSWGAPNAQHRPGEHTSNALTAGERQERPLQLTTTIIRKKYCKNDDSSLALNLKLQLRYTNVGNQPLILYKGSKLIHRHTTSRSVEDAEAKRFTSDYSLSIYSEGGSEINKSSLDRLFVILQPGDKYEREALNIVALRVVPDATEAPAGALPPGEYFLQVETSSWPESDELAKDLHNQWRQSGLLWYDPVVSVPMQLKVERRRSVVECP